MLYDPGSDGLSHRRRQYIPEADKNTEGAFDAKDGEMGLDRRNPTPRQACPIWSDSLSGIDSCLGLLLAWTAPKCPRGGRGGIYRSGLV